MKEKTLKEIARKMVNISMIMLFYLLYTLGVQESSIYYLFPAGAILGIFWDWEDNILVRKMFPLKEDKE